MHRKDETGREFFTKEMIFGSLCMKQEFAHQINLEYGIEKCFPSRKKSLFIIYMYKKKKPKQIWRLVLGNASSLFGWNFMCLERVYRDGVLKGSKGNTDLVILRSLAFVQFCLWSVKCWWPLPATTHSKPFKSILVNSICRRNVFNMLGKKWHNVKQQTRIKYLHCTEWFF